MKESSTSRKRPPSTSESVRGHSTIAVDMQSMLRDHNHSRTFLGRLNRTIPVKWVRSLFAGATQRKIDRLIDNYVERLGQGEALDRFEFILDYPDIRIDLAIALAVNPRIRAIEEQRDLIKASAPVVDDADYSEFETTLGHTVSAAVDGFHVVKEAARNFSDTRITIDDYEIIERIGAGAMGCIYKAWHEPTNRYVALKTLRPGLEVNARQIERFFREAIAQSKLDHPNIVSVYDFGRHDNITYLVLELIENGTTLQSMLDDNDGPLEGDAVARLVRDISSAVAYCHNQGVCHRDIKPANILVHDRTPKLTDFGLAFDRDMNANRLTRSGEILGTLFYMPPELLDRKSGDDSGPTPQSDIYALGVTLYMLLAGRPPFKARSARDLIDKVVYEKPIPLNSPQLSVAPSLEAICAKCMEKLPRNRYSDARSLADDLTRYLDGEPILPAPRPTIRERLKTVSVSLPWSKTR